MHRQARADKCEGPACDRTEQQATRARSGEAPGKTPALAGPAGHRWHETQLGEPPKASNQHTLGSGLACSKTLSQGPGSSRDPSHCGTRYSGWVNLFFGTRLPN